MSEPTSESPRDQPTSLPRAAARGASVVFAGQGIRIAVQLAGIVILARLLSPEDYGLLAMVTAIVGAAEIIRDFGLAPAAIQAKNLSVAERSNLFWLNGGIGLVLAGGVAGAGHLIALIYDDQRMVLIAICLSPIYLLNGLSAQYRADLTRRLKFLQLTLSEVVAQVAALVVGVAFALMGFGFWALVAQQVAQALVLVILVIVLAGWLPNWYDRTTGVGRFLRYGGSLLATQLLVYASSNADTFLIGLRYGPAQLGYYNRAFQMLVLPLNQITSPAMRVALPVLSRLQDSPRDFHRYLLRGQLALSWLVIPALAFLSVHASAVVDFALGPRWSAAAPIFAILAIGGAFQTLSNVTYWTFLATGKTASNLRFALCTRSLMIAAIVIGATFGIHEVAWAYSASLAIIWVLGLLWVSRATGVPGLRMFLSGGRSLAMWSFVGWTSWLVTSLLPPMPPALSLLVAGASFAATAALLIVAIPPVRTDARSLAQTFTLIRRRRSHPKGSK